MLAGHGLQLTFDVGQLVAFLDRAVQRQLRPVVWAMAPTSGSIWFEKEEPSTGTRIRVYMREELLQGWTVGTARLGRAPARRAAPAKCVRKIPRAVLACAMRWLRRGA
ncbi:hypothetical protein [Ottowia beijingensis]|uniref:hypothetical protein n=1 Tax=Ottowia beijingensis TaxID=1207057 RepID=UPI00214DCE8F|nr:hypothetical protein [Ottowia beijingensis]